MEVRLLAVDNNIKFFEEQQQEWIRYGIDPIRVSSMKTAISKLSDEFVFIGINADSIEYMPHLRIMREATSLPIHIFTSNFSIREQIEALHQGATCYEEWWPNIVERVKRGAAIIQTYIKMNSHPSQQTKIISYKDIYIYPQYYIVFVRNTEINLTKKEFELLCLFLSNPKRVYTNKQILRTVWGEEYDDSDNTILWSEVKRLRKKLKQTSDDSEYIRNIRDVGYRFD